MGNHAQDRARQTHPADAAGSHWQTEVQGAIAGEDLPGREHDETEVRNYYRALEAVDALAASQAPIMEADVQRLHGLVMTGRPVPTPYRDGQNIIREAGTGRIV
jgi:Fic family protein